MWITCTIVGAFVLALIAVEYFAIQGREEEAHRERARGGDGAAPTGALALVAPDRPVTSDEIVYELEHRIEEELRDITYAMRAPERYRHIFDA
jgi:hypothetical protein